MDAPEAKPEAPVVTLRIELENNLHIECGCRLAPVDGEEGQHGVVPEIIWARDANTKTLVPRELFGRLVTPNTLKESLKGLLWALEEDEANDNLKGIPEGFIDALRELTGEPNDDNDSHDVSLEGFDEEDYDPEDYRDWEESFEDDDE
jgi:hypothetical protein